MSNHYSQERSSVPACGKKPQRGDKKPKVILEAPKVPNTSIAQVSPVIDIEKSLPKKLVRNFKRAGVTPSEAIFMILALGAIIVLVYFGKTNALNH